ncbi:MAG: hypothetical protein IJK84_01625 [Bacteroidales bacterium]|nr:hypothetical protein [Bacteroidales bacterium]
MKKTVLFLVIVLLAIGAFAQSHSYRDTLHVKYEYFDLWDFFSDTSSRYRNCYQMGVPVKPGTNAQLLRHDIVQYNFTNDPNGLKVVGISAVIKMSGGPTSFPMNPPEYLLLYDAVTDTFDLKASVQWEVRDTVGRPPYDWILAFENGKPTTWSAYYHTTVPRNWTVFDMYLTNLQGCMTRSMWEERVGWDRL